MKKLQKNIVITMSITLFLALHSTDFPAPAERTLGALHAQAAKENLVLIIGNKIPAVKHWQVPNHDALKIVAEGGRTRISASSSEPHMVFEVHADANILEHFIATQSPEGEFCVKPREGLLLASYTPVLLRLRMPNGNIPIISTQVGNRVISLPSPLSNV